MSPAIQPKTILATEKEVRMHYRSQGYEVRISKEGRVQFRNAGCGWQEGRYVGEYRSFNGQVVPA